MLFRSKSVRKQTTWHASGHLIPADRDIRLSTVVSRFVLAEREEEANGIIREYDWACGKKSQRAGVEVPGRLWNPREENGGEECGLRWMWTVH